MTSSPVRWAAKKAGRTLMAHATHALTACSRALALGRPGVRVLTYHAFGSRPRDAFCVDAKSFDAQMRHLSRHSMAIDLAELERHLDGEIDSSRDRVLVTIDDGLSSVRSVALPILREHGIPAVVFASAGLIGIKTDEAAGVAGESYLDWDDLEHLTRCGVSVQSHGWEHHALTRLSPAGLHEALEESKALLEHHLGKSVFAFAYPYGTRADFDEATARAAASAGYRLAFTSQHGAVRPGLERHLLPRVKVEGGEGLATFAALVKGGLDPWRWIDRSLWRLQANH